MDLSLTRDTVRFDEPVFESAADHPIESDVILPDYCPDIARILKTEANASIQSKAVESGRLTVSGKFIMRVIYIPENSSAIRCFAHEEPYTHIFDLPGDGDGVHVKANVKVPYANLRPIGPRRVQIKAAAGISVKAWAPCEENFVSGGDPNACEMLVKGTRASSLVGAADKEFKLSDELEIGYGKPEIASIIKADAVAIMQDYKVISNKVIAKGELLLHTVYSCDAGENTGSKLEVMDHSIPISQIIDLDGVDEDCACEINFKPSDVKVEGVADADGENRVFAVEMNLSASVRAYRMKDFNVVADAFSPAYESNVKMRPMNLESIADNIKANEMVRGSVDITGQDIASVTDSSAEPEITGVQFEGKNLVITGNMKVSILAVDSQGGPAGLDRQLPFRITQEVKNAADNMRSEPEITVMSTAYSMLGQERIDMRIECMVEAMVFGISTVNAVADMEIDESKPKDCSQRKALVLYYADEGERVWDIAKRYNTSMEAIKRENGMEGDTLDERIMLLIPKKRSSKTD